jgi:hypothetical protein
LGINSLGGGGVCSAATVVDEDGVVDAFVIPAESSLAEPPKLMKSANADTIATMAPITAIDHFHQFENRGKGGLVIPNPWRVFSSSAGSGHTERGCSGIAERMVLGGTSESAVASRKALANSFTD